MEWALALTCMVPAAVSDLKYRITSLESCVASLLVGCAVFIWWALEAPLHDVVGGMLMVGVVAVIVGVAGRVGLIGDGDWWFVTGVCAAMSTLGVMATMWAVFAGMGAVMVCHVAMCVRRPGMPFPHRLISHVKRKGDKFRVRLDNGDLAEPDESGMAVRPGLPLVTFLVPAAIIVGVLFSL